MTRTIHKQHPRKANLTPGFTFLKCYFKKLFLLHELNSLHLYRYDLTTTSCLNKASKKSRAFQNVLQENNSTFNRSTFEIFRMDKQKVIQLLIPLNNILP